ncbi:hypothetical protein [Bacillus sp. FJAT-45350]|uniref:hypothetical protein n=1 Tax=Bacillus sp. FJAT-45350 TaxID=2011014 RepID=UPI000BB7C9DF|nr:hypothetical protein [Bacillus sp. FJAT-45350]
MIYVCQSHVSEGVKMLRVPHVKKVDHEAGCLICKRRASFEVYYYKAGKRFSKVMAPKQIAN